MLSFNIFLSVERWEDAGRFRAIGFRGLGFRVWAQYIKLRLQVPKRKALGFKSHSEYLEP